VDSGKLSHLSLKGILVFLFTGVLSLMAIVSFIVPGVDRIGAVYIPLYSANYWFLIIFFLMVAGLIFYELVQRREAAAESSEISALKEILVWVAPLSAGLMASIFVLPFFRIDQPLFYSGYAFLSLLLYICAGRYHILEITESNQHILPQFAVAATFMLIFYFTPGESHDFSTIFLSIPLLIACTLLGQYILILFASNFKRVRLGYHEMIETEKKIEQFSGGAARFTELRHLWEYLAEFCKENFDISRIAVITLQNDVNPYRIDYLENFTEDEIRFLLKTDTGSLPEVLEAEKQIINKFDLPAESELYQTMERLKMYTAAPLFNKDQLKGMILLGGERQYAPFPQRNIHTLKLLSAHIARAMEDIQTIENMLQTQKMAGLGMLASQVAHDFRSFMALTKNYTAENSKLKKHADYMEKMVGDLLTYARPPELKLTPVFIHQLIDMSLEGIQIPTEIILEKNYANNLPRIPLDIHQMRRVFSNLIENSLRAMRMSEGCRLQISTRALRSPSRFNRASWLHIEILDEGVGIPEEFIDRLFDPFFTTYKTEGGTGFGLAIAKQIINRHGGFIDVTSQPGKYTVFNIRLPYRLEKDV
jgi:signal transduction histidine kinase